MRLPPLYSVKSNFAPGLTFWGANASVPGPVIAYVAYENNQMMLVNPYAALNTSSTGTPVALIAPPGGHDIPVLCSGPPAVAAYLQWLVIAWADINRNINIADSLDGVHFGNSVSWQQWPQLQCMKGTGPCVGFTPDGHISVFWVDATGAIRSTVRMMPDSRVPWSPVGTQNDNAIGTPAVTNLPQNYNAAEAANYVQYLAWTRQDGSVVHPLGIVGPNVTQHGPAIASWYNGEQNWLAYTGLDTHFRSLGNAGGALTTQFMKKHSDTSNYSPALAFDPSGSLWWAWTGTDTPQGWTPPPGWDGTTPPPGSMNFQNNVDMTP